MNLFQKYILALVVFSLCTLAIILITAGVFLTVMTVTAGAVMYYPLTAVEWLVSRMRRTPK